ncbi:MAG TPA: RNA polymerase sigma factor [Terriglobales bacterium]|nr:RNA polymerase sigma factor [Terriglobales bacterium]
MDEETFRAFYERTARPLWAYLVRVSGQRDLADDLLQESYCRFLSVDLPRMDEAQQKSYLFRIATNLLRDRWRRMENTTASDATQAGAYEDDIGTKADVRRALELLKPRERQLLWLAYVEGSNHKEIADCTGLRVGSVRLLLFRARRKLADLLRVRAGNSVESSTEKVCL